MNVFAKEVDNRFGSNSAGLQRFRIYAYGLLQCLPALGVQLKLGISCTAQIGPLLSFGLP